MDVVISIPDEIAEEWQTDAVGLKRRLHVELALHLYATRRLSLGRAAEISGLTRGAFEQELDKAGIDRNYSSEDLEADLGWARQRPRPC